jgi:hypothetical protein
MELEIQNSKCKIQKWDAFGSTLPFLPFATNHESVTLLLLTTNY